MILDKQEFYLTSAGSSVLGGGSSANSEYRDTGVAAQFDNAHRKQFVNLRCIVGQAGTSPTLAITLKGGTDGSTFGTTVLTLHATAILNAGTVYKVPLPANMPRTNESNRCHRDSLRMVSPGARAPPRIPSFAKPPGHISIWPST